MTFTSEQFDVFYGPWNTTKAALVRRYIDEETYCWTPKEVQVTRLLREFLNETYPEGRKSGE